MTVVKRKIQRLSESVIQKIAAGEVVERPASIVKELLENSLDAGARRIEIRLADGGKKAIHIVDDGQGMSPEEALLALERHATSKISQAEDLDSIETFGFRGEALASIGAISHLELMTRPEGESEGTKIRVMGGEKKGPMPHGHPVGTSIHVSNLFYNVPTRKKFLKGKTTELGHIDTMIRRMALTHFDRSFLVEHEGTVSLQTSACDSLKERLLQLYGEDVCKNLVPVEAQEGPLRVSGFISNAHLNYSRAKELWLSVNGRHVRDRVLQAAVMEGYRTALMERRYPFAVIQVHVPPDTVDVNIHPTKMEVRFSDSQSVFRLIVHAISNALTSKEVLTPSSWKPSFSHAASQAPTTSGSFGFSNVVARMPAEPYRADPTPQEGFFSALEWLGVLDHTYQLCRTADELIVIDQHAAHERVLFEKLKKAYQTQKPECQTLLLPITFETTPERERQLLDLAPLLQKLGFLIESFGPRTLVVKEVPAILAKTNPESLLIDLADAAETENKEAPFVDRLDDLFSRMACHRSIRAHDAITASEFRALAQALDESDHPSQCPHGRPTFLRLSIEDLERLFKRA